MKKLIIVIEGPGGVGKDSVMQGLIEKYPNTYKKLPSITTRKMREGESQGNPYFFVGDEEFKQLIAERKVFEYTTHHDGTFRGMSASLIEEIWDAGLLPLKDVDMVGVNALKRKYPGRTLTIFMKASRAEVEARLRKRGGCELDIQVRLNSFDAKMKIEPEFDYSIENKILHETIDKIHTIIQNYIVDNNLT